MAGAPPCISHFSGAMSASRVQNKKKWSVLRAALKRGGGAGRRTLDPTLDPILDPTLDPTLDLILDPENMQEHCLRFATFCSAHRSPELVKSIPNASRKNKHASAFVVTFATLCSAHRSPELGKRIPTASR